MKHTMMILVIFIIAILAISTADSAPGTPVPVRTMIKIGSIDYGSAAPGNSEPVTIMVSVLSTVYPNGICGLDKSNFKIEVPTHGFGYTGIVIKDVLGVASTAVGSPTSCSYGVKIAPGIYQGKQYKWANSPGAFNLYYFRGGNQIAVATFNLKMYAN
ncbi:Uncharacterised protein [uncultured archaeon]|nr:Uncharacterised protein [uncultured archaeon]